MEGDAVIRSILRVLGKLLDTLDIDGDLPMCILAEPVGELTGNKITTLTAVYTYIHVDHITP